MSSDDDVVVEPSSEIEHAGFFAGDSMSDPMPGLEPDAAANPEHQRVDVKEAEKGRRGAVTLSNREAQDRYLERQIEQSKRRKTEKKEHLRSTITPQDKLVRSWIEQYGQDHIQVKLGILSDLEKEYIVKQREFMSKRQGPE